MLSCEICQIFKTTYFGEYWRTTTSDYFFFYIVESKERNAERLASDMTIIREQITFFDALQTDIITLLDNKIITKMNQFRRELEVTYFRYFAQ